MTAPPSLDTTALVRLAPVIRNELKRLALSGSQSAAASLNHVFTHLFGADRPRQDQIRFMVYAAPLARRIAIDLASSGDRIGDSEVRVSDLREWLGWLDMFDPLCARMIDLHYFAGLTTKETAQALKLPTQAVIRDLRFAKTWLQAKLPEGGLHGSAAG
jgi:DNA-directed RNA polymerase specialized sigma24 family protein